METLLRLSAKDISQIARSRIKTAVDTLWLGNGKSRPRKPEFEGDREKLELANEIFSSLSEQIKRYVGENSATFPSTLVLTASKKQENAVFGKRLVKQWVSVKRKSGLQEFAVDIGKEKKLLHGLPASKYDDGITLALPNTLPDMGIMLVHFYFSLKPKNQTIRSRFINILSSHIGEEYNYRDDDFLYNDILGMNFSHMLSVDEWISSQESASVSAHINIGGTIFQTLYHSNANKTGRSFTRKIEEADNEVILSGTYVENYTSSTISRINGTKNNLLVCAFYQTLMVLVPGSPTDVKSKQATASSFVPILNRQAV